MERNIFQQLQAIEQQLLAKKGIQVHIHISLSPGSAGLSESDVKQLMDDVDSVSTSRAEKVKFDAECVPREIREKTVGVIRVTDDRIFVSQKDKIGASFCNIDEVNDPGLKEATRILSAWLNFPSQPLVWKEWSKPDRPGLWAFTYPTANGTVFYQEVSEEGAKHPERWDSGHWCYIGPAPKIEYRQKQEELETIPTEHWPKWYVPVKPVESGRNKSIAYYRRDDKNKGTTFHVDGTSFTFTDWYNVNAMEVPEQEAKARCQNENEFWEQFRTREQDLFSLRAAETKRSIHRIAGAVYLGETQCEFKIIGKTREDMIRAYDSLVHWAKDGHKRESVTMEFIHDRPNRIGIWAYKTSTEFSDGRLAYTVVDDVSKCNVVPSPGRWAYVGDHR